LIVNVSAILKQQTTLNKLYLLKLILH